MADKCPNCGEKEILTFMVGRKELNFLTRLALGHHHGARTGTMDQVACAKCHATYMKEVA